MRWREHASAGTMRYLTGNRDGTPSRRTEVVGRAALMSLVVCLALSACRASGEPKSTVIDGRRVLLIRDSDCHGDCPAPTSIVRMGDRYYSGSCKPARVNARHGELFAIRDRKDVTHDWLEARVIRGFDSRIIVAVRYRNSDHCRAGGWFLASVPQNPTNPAEARRFAEAWCNAGWVPLFKLCATGGPFDWSHGDDHGSVRIAPRR